jgi:hypothetical protein
MNQLPKEKVISFVAYIRINNMIEVTQISTINQTLLISRQNFQEKYCHSSPIKRQCFVRKWLI